MVNNYELLTVTLEDFNKVTIERYHKLYKMVMECYPAMNALDVSFLFNMTTELPFFSSEMMLSNGLINPDTPFMEHAKSQMFFVELIEVMTELSFNFAFDQAILEWKDEINNQSTYEDKLVEEIQENINENIFEITEEFVVLAVEYFISYGYFVCHHGKDGVIYYNQPQKGCW